MKNPFLENNHRVRFATVMLLYFAQGIPRGLLQVAMPAWLASQGLSAAAIASYLAVVILPWVFKLFTGPVMDRFQYPTMGLRRPWVLGAQLGMSLSLCLLTAVTDPIAQFGLLTAIAVIVLLQWYPACITLFAQCVARSERWSVNAICCGH